MGTDIHAFIEYRLASDDIWRTYGEVFLEREYGLFAAIAGVCATEDTTTLFEPRGFPADASAFAQRAYYAHIVPDKEFVHDGSSRFVRASDVAGIINSGGHYRHQSKDMISHPDALYPSWLSISEIQCALRAIGIGNETLGIGWQLALRTMQVIEAEFRAEVRLAFWFEI
ncbi:MAG: hypothetical protein ABI779_09360 [Acidobacteriota bacterium]